MASSRRYKEKISLIGVDPYQIDPIALSKDPSLLPAVTYPDIYNYLVHTVSAYTSQELKAFKSLESYNYFISGKVGSLLTFVPPTTSSNIVVIAEVCKCFFDLMMIIAVANVSISCV